MLKCKSTLADYVHYAPSSSSGHTCAMGFICNHLEDDIKASVSINGSKPEGAGPVVSSGGYSSTVKAKGDLKIDDYTKRPSAGSRIDKFKLILSLDRIPSKNGVEAVKVIPGSKLGIAHHFEFHDNDDATFDAVIHYTVNSGGTLKPHTDIDPSIGHPEDG